MVIEATVSEAEQISEALARVMCPDDGHDGECAVPWTLMRSGFEHVDDADVATWMTEFAREKPTSAIVVDDDQSAP
jgi:hypothetical protein